MKTLTTDSLTLRPLTLEDAPDIHEIYSDERAMRFIPFDRHETLQQTENKIQSDLYKDGAHHWVVTLTGTDKAIGVINYLASTRFPGMGYVLHPDYWGQGITAEACRAVLDYGFEHLGYDRVELWIDETNTSSSRVAQKLGFLPKSRMPLKDAHSDQYHFLLVWGMRKTQWQGTEYHPKEIAFYSAEPVLHVKNLMATTDYYRDKLGFNVDFFYGDPPYYAIATRGEWSESLVSIHFSEASPEREINSTVNLHIRVGMGLDDLYAQYKENGVDIEDAPEDKPWGFRELTIRDLDGHRLVLAQYP